MEVGRYVIGGVIWIVCMIFVVRVLWKDHCRKKVEKETLLKKGYRKVNKIEVFQIAKEFLGKEYRDLLRDFNIEGIKSGFIRGFLSPAKMYIKITGKYKGWEVEYKYLIAPTVIDEDGVTHLDDYVGHHFLIKYQPKKKIVFSRAEKPICKDLVLLHNGMVRFYAIVEMGVKIKFREPFQESLLRKEEYKRILGSISEVLGKLRAGSYIENEQVSQFFPERFEIIRIEDAVYTRMSGRNRRIVEMKLLDELFYC